MRIGNNYFHVLRQNHGLKMQYDFIFIDTETNITKINKNTEIQTLKFGYAIYWNREKDETKTKEFTILNDLYNFIDDCFLYTNKIILFSHNMDFDIKIINGYTEFIVNRQWLLKSPPYINSDVFILNLIKNDKELCVLSTTNFFRLPLRDIGNFLGFKKLNIDFSDCSMDELKTYCIRDTEIIYKLIRSLINFLTEDKLSKLKNTASSLAFNTFIHKFYDKKVNPISIHNWRYAIELERHSFRGGISDCFKIGHFTEKLYKLDINSMYPYIMRNYELPYRLIFYGEYPTLSYEQLQKNYEKALLANSFVIANCDIELPIEYAYILVKTKINKEKKSTFLSGSFSVSLTSPELEFVIKYGKILKIHKLAIYQKGLLFKDYIDYFYEKRLKYKKENNRAYSEFCKLMMNSLYGKFGQHETELIYIKDNEDYAFKESVGIDLINDKTYNMIQIGNKSYVNSELKENSFNSFVAISSAVTSYARMYIIDLVLKTERDNVYYVDTDCLFVNEKGFQNLKEFIDNEKLGFLKIEDVSNDTTIINPKYYVFNKKNKRKGVKSTAKIIKETNKILTIEQPQFQKYKSALKNNELDKQVVKMVKKRISKKYTKGNIDGFNTFPFHVMLKEVC